MSRHGSQRWRQADGTWTSRPTEYNINRFKFCGKHSGIPDCCIEWFCSDEYCNYLLTQLKEYSAIVDMKAKNIGQTIPYAPCKKCLEGKFFLKKLNACNCGETLRSLCQK